MNEVCAGCGHSMSMHFRNVLCEVRCLHSYVCTSSGAIITSTIHCDCVNYVSKSKDARRDGKRRKDEEHNKEMAELIEEIKRSGGIKFLPKGVTPCTIPEEPKSKSVTEF